MKRPFVFLYLIITLSLPLFADTVTLKVQYISPSTSENRNFMESMVVRAAAGASRRYSEYMEVYPRQEYRRDGDYNINITAVLEGETPVINLQMGDLTQALMGPFDETSYLFLSEVVFKLWSLKNPDAISQDMDSPLFMEEVPASFILQSAIPDFEGYDTVSAAAVKENGNLVLALGSLCYEVDNNFDIVAPIGQDQFKANGSTFLMGTSVTPGGSVFLKPANGREIFKVIEGAPRTMKIRAGIDVSGPMAALPSGTAILFDTAGKKFIRLEGTRRSELPINLNPYAYIYSMAPGPEGNLWLFDNMEQRFKIYSEEGTYINSIIPIGLGTDTLFPMSMIISRDGSIIAYNNTGSLYRFNRKGVLLWKMSSYMNREEENFPMTPMNLALDEKEGYIYLADYAAKRILKFYDPELDSGEKNRDVQTVLTLNRDLNRDPYSEIPVRAKADYYLKRQSWVLASLWLEELVNLNPFDQQAADQLDGIEISALMKQAADLEEETLDIAKRIGPESARDLFSRTISLYEKILSMDGSNNEASSRMNRFREAYNREAAGIGSGERPLTIAALSIDGIFPSLIHYYKNNPIGTVRIRNDLSTPVENIRASLDLGRFIDFPIESDKTDLLPPGEETVLNLKILLNDQAFNLSEDLPLPVQVKILWEQDGLERSAVKTAAAQMYRRTALTWDDTAKLAAFIMPNETIVSAFSHRVLGTETQNEGLPEKMVRAARICDALGTYGINYVEDPDSPLSQVFGKEQRVDTVRYPRTTLHIRSGDCDDSTALLASLLESSGIATAIMTSPGHVFLAVDTEEPSANRWMFERENKNIIIHSGTIWIPIETTVLQRGFNGAWESASNIIARSSRDDIEFLPVAEQRENYPPLPLGESHLLVVEPSESAVNSINGESLALMKNFLYQSNVQDLEQAIRNSSGRRKRQNNNRLAILQARFGEYRKAERIFQELIDEDASYLSPYMNLGNLYYIQGKYADSLAIYNKALNLNSGSVMLNLALAKTYYRLGDRANTAKFFRLVEGESKEISEKYAYLSNSNGVVRAGIDDEPPVGWAGE
jgi:tetratricopeptide (TPR) repeat protein